MTSNTGYLQGRKNTRSCIFSGSSRLVYSVASLRSIASGIVSRNIFCYRNQPASSFKAMKPILAKLTHTQLQQFLDANPDLTDDCDPLYRVHCHVNFELAKCASFDDIIKKLRKSKFVQANPCALDGVTASWAQLYDLLNQEQEYRLKQLNDSIQRNNRMIKQNERKTVLLNASHRTPIANSAAMGKAGKAAKLYTRTGVPSTARLPAKPIAPLMRKCLDIKKRYNTLLK